MSIMRIETGRFCWLVAALLAVPACSGGQTGDGTGTQDDDNDPEGNANTEGGYCNYQTELLTDLDDASELGFSARDILNFAVTPVSTTFGWSGGELAQVGPETGVSPLTLALGYSDGAVRVRRPGPPRQTQSGDPEIVENTIDTDIAVDCRPALELEVDVSFRTGGGALDESFEAVLVAEAPQLATFVEQVKAEDLGGSLEVLATRPAGGVLRNVQINASISTLGTYGSVGAGLDYNIGGADSEAAVSGFGLIGRFPADNACESEGRPGVSVAADTDLGGYTPAGTLDLLSEISPTTLRWQDSTESELTLSVVPAGTGCAQFEFAEAPFDYSTVNLASYGSGWRLTTPVTISAESADGRWQGSYSGLVTTLPNAEGDGLAQVSLRVFLENLAPAAFASSSGLSGVDLSDYDYGRLVLELDLDVAAGSHTGNVIAQGASVAECVNNPPDSQSQFSAGGAAGSGAGSPGCAGTDLETVWSGTF